MKSLQKEALVFNAIALALSVTGIIYVVVAVLLGATQPVLAVGYAAIAASVIMTVISRFRYPSSKLTGYEAATKRTDEKMEKLRELVKK